MVNSSYADGFNISSGLVETKIEFFESEPVIDGNGAIISEEKCVNQKVVMSLSLAKELAKKLNEMIAAYEKNIAPIADLRDLQKRAAENGK